MKTLLLMSLLAIAVSAQSQSVQCGSQTAADPLQAGGKSPVAAVAAQVRRPVPNRPAVSCRCGTVGAGSLTAQSNSQEVPILTGVAGSFRFDHVLVQESKLFVSDTAGSLVVGVGRASFGTDVVSPFPLKSGLAPNNSWYERPTPPQLTGAYDLVLNFKASSPLGDGAASHFSSGTVSWEVCGYNTPAR